MLSPTYEITTALSHTDELISPPYDIAIVTISYGRVTMSSVWDSMMSKKNMGWPFYAAVINSHWALLGIYGTVRTFPIEGIIKSVTHVSSATHDKEIEQFGPTCPQVRMRYGCDIIQMVEPLQWLLMARISPIQHYQVRRWSDFPTNTFYRSIRNIAVFLVHNRNN